MKYKVKSLFIYPVKSFGGMQIPQMEITETGPKYDRQWMVVNEKGEFMTQRQFPKMSQATARIFEDSQVELTAPGMEFMDFGVEEFNPEAKTEVKIWKNTAEAHGVDPEVSEWVSDFLGEKCKLVRLSDEANITIAPDYGDGQTSFTDGFPFLILFPKTLVKR